MLGTFWLALLALVSTATSESISGTREPCSNEGEIVNVDLRYKITNIRCFTCRCKNGFIECEKEQCPSQEGCHMLLDLPKDGCCRKCKGCSYKNATFESDTEWVDPDDPCKVLSCRAGVVTETVEQCYVPCKNPLPPAPGQCCPTCIGCRVNGQTVSAGRTIRSLEDPCLKCQCSKNKGGRLSCSKRACPVLHCSPSSVQQPRPGECCPTCIGSRELIMPPSGKCILGSELYTAGHLARPDKCTVCECYNGTNVCRRPSCPVLDCPPENQIMKDGGCCSFCPPRPKLSGTCTHKGKTYMEGESWDVDLCKSCVCKDGTVRCAAEMCTQMNKPCPPNHKLVEVKGQCCPKCVESDGVCTVFGDPHYRTFDGKFYSFQGSCKYQLTKDCAGESFSIRVTNDARDTKISSWTKTVSIRIGATKINLGEKRRVKVNGTRIFVPETRKSLKITETDDSVLVETEIGIKVLWNGNSVLEVSVPAKYKGKLCGLCGNFNNIPRDDFITKTGRIVSDPDKFGNSWRVGGKRACSRGNAVEPYHRPPSRCFKYGPQRRQSERLCRILKSRVFEPCHSHIHFFLYYKSCLMDMCECPGNMCYCESLTAYAHECSRLAGVSLPNWREDTQCLARH